MLNYVGTVVVKREAKGAFFAGDGHKKMLPSFNVDALDTTGAGDAFDAGFIAAIINNKRIEEAVQWGNGSAALKVQQKGARTGLPTKEGLMSFLRSQNK